LAGAANVIRGHAQFSIDLRAPLDARRQAALAGLRAGIDAIARDRALQATVAITHEADPSGGRSSRSASQ
jgi:acetylornithine deacetylase/succinyl-diaminopimelate desuccinylase-like protein